MTTRARYGLMTPGRMYEAEKRWAKDLPDRFQRNLTQRQVVSLVYKCCREYGRHDRTLPAVRFTGKSGGASGGTWRLMFTHNKKTQVTPTWLVLHEAAHCLAPARSRHDLAWLTIYGDLAGRHISKKAERQCVLLLGAELPTTG